MRRARYSLRADGDNALLFYRRSARKADASNGEAKRRRPCGVSQPVERPFRRIALLAARYGTKAAWAPRGSPESRPSVRRRVGPLEAKLANSPPRR